jgi:outer membrane protein assembly factor BamD (BamD/ComL family)
MLAELEADALRLAGERGQAALLYLEAAALSASPERARLHAARAEMWETAPPKPEAAEQAWNEVLASAPTERLAAKALLRLGALAQQRGAIDLAAQRFASLMQQYPSAPEAASALALWGKSKLDAQQWAQAESLFVAHRDAPAALLAETALVGWVRAQVGKADRAAALTGIREHQERFPNGARRHEIERLRRALSDGD